MAQDRVVYWPSGEKPPKTDIQHALEDYLRGVSSRVEWQNGVLYAELPGICSTPLRRLRSATDAARRQYDEPYYGRFIEVCFDEQSIDVKTTLADPITNRIADGFAHFCRGFWAGLMDVDHEPPCEIEHTALLDLGGPWQLRAPLPIAIRAYRHGRHRAEYAAVWEETMVWAYGNSATTATLWLETAVNLLCQRLYDVPPDELSVLSRDLRELLRRAVQPR